MSKLDSETKKEIVISLLQSEKLAKEYGASQNMKAMLEYPGFSEHLRKELGDRAVDNLLSANGLK